MPDVENSPIFGLLTDALRAGPGSPEWHQAVGKLRADGLADSDEYRLLVAVREHLESGRDYRSVRAGPGFTRKVMAAIEQERQHDATGKRGGLPVAGIVAVVSGIVVLGLLAALAFQLASRPAGGGGAGEQTVEELEQTFLPTELATAKFDGAIPAGWRTVGALQLDAGHTGLRPAAPVAPPAGSPAAADAVGGAVLISQPVPADEPFAVVVQLKPGRPADDLIVQVFVSAAEDFSPDKATSSNELVWLLQGSRQKVVAGDRMEVDAPRPDAAGKPDGKGDPLVVRLVVGKQLAVVSTGAQRLWAGPSGLAAKPRTVGVRYIRLDGTKPAGDPPVVQSIRVLKR